MKVRNILILAACAAMLAGCGRVGSVADRKPVPTDGPVNPVKG